MGQTMILRLGIGLGEVRLGASRDEVRKVAGPPFKAFMKASVTPADAFIGKGLTAFEKYLDDGATGSFCHGETVSMADCCLIPQLYNAKRWGADYSGLEKICAIEETCGRVNAFVDAHPDQCNPNGL